MTAYGLQVGKISFLTFCRHCVRKHIYESFYDYVIFFTCHCHAILSPSNSIFFNENEWSKIKCCDATSSTVLEKCSAGEPWKKSKQEWKYRKLGSDGALSLGGAKNGTSTIAHLWLHSAGGCQRKSLCLPTNSPLIPRVPLAGTPVSLGHSMLSVPHVGTISSSQQRKYVANKWSCHLSVGW